MTALTAPERLEVTIQRLVSGGLGMAFHDGLTLFVPHAAPGDRVRVVSRHLRGRTLSADIEEILEPGPARIQPFCPHYARCGGCQMQHLAPDAVLEIKRGFVSDALSHVGRLPDVEVWPTLPPSAWQGSRQRASLKSRRVEGAQWLGFYEPNSRHLVDLPGCPVLHPRLEGLMGPLRACLGGLSVADALPQMDVTCADDGAGVLLHLLRPLQVGDEAALRGWAREQGLSQLWLRLGEKSWPLVDEGPIRYDFEGLSFHYRPGEFTQNNLAMNRLLIREVLDRAGEGEQALDLFCGMGNFTLPLARCFRRVTGVEVQSAALRRGEENARRNGLDHVVFRHADLFAPAGVGALPLEQAGCVVLDPPRDGALALVKRLAQKPGPRLVYVSCNPATFARDAAILVHGGYALGPVQPVEMFPHTHHVELVASFEPRR